jgi:hypothetical protein
VSQNPSLHCVDPYHYPPELIEQLIETIPLLIRSREGVLEFLRGAGIDEKHLRDLRTELRRDPASVTKYRIVRMVLPLINQDGDLALRARRELVRRVTEFEDFSLCWPDDQLKAKGLVASIRDTVNRRDSFTRMRDAEEKHRIAHQREHDQKAIVAERKRSALRVINKDLCALFAETNPWHRGKKLEGILNKWCAVCGISIRDAFLVRGNEHEGTVEQIDGVVAINNKYFLVEMKWHSEPLGVDVVGIHLSHIIFRADVGGLLISASGFTGPAVATSRDALTKVVNVLCDLEELVRLSAREGDLVAFLKRKVEAATLDHNPFLRIVD